MQKIHIKRFSTASIIIASVLSVVFAAISIYGIKDFKELENSTEQYLVCERSALKLQKGSDVLTEQARLYVMTGDAGCMEEYFEEVNVNRNRESAVEELGLALLIICLVIDSIIVRKLIVNPLVSYNESIEQDETVPVIGAAELQSLAETYNRVFEENRETQKLIRHEAEHDALTDLLNKGSFDKILSLYDQGQMPFALIIADIDRFKSFNDTYGHSTGDAVIRKVAQRLKTSFRSTDYIFRIGGDEFAVIMIDVSESLRGTVEEKLNALKESLANDSDGFPAVTLSIGVAFSDRTAPGDSIFEDADSALYYAKNNGRNGSRFY